MLTAEQVAELLVLIDAYADRKLEREHEKARAARRKLVRAMEALMRPAGVGEVSRG